MCGLSADFGNTGHSPADPSTWIESLAGHDGRNLTDTECIDQIRELERLKGAVAAAQARITDAFDRSQRGAAPASRPANEVSRSVASQVALARRESPSRGRSTSGCRLPWFATCPRRTLR